MLLMGMDAVIHDQLRMGGHAVHQILLFAKSEEMVLLKVLKVEMITMQ